MLVPYFQRNPKMPKKNNWNPKVGELVVYRGSGSPYAILEVRPTNYGYTEFVAYRDGEMKNLSTLNCEPIEHVLPRE